MQTQQFSLLSTDYAMSSGMTQSLNKVIKFLLEHKDLMMDDESFHRIMSFRSPVNTPISSIYEKIIETNARQIYTCFIPPTGSNVVSVPDLLTLNSVTIDLGSLKNNDLVKYFPQYKNKIVINLGGLIKYPHPGGVPIITDSFEIQSLFVRGALCRSFLANSSERWLTPSIMKFVVKTFALYLSSMIGQVRALNWIEQSSIALCFAAFISKKLSGNVANNIPIGLQSVDFVSRDVVTHFVDKNKSILEQPMDVNKLAMLIATNGPERMTQFSSTELYTVCKSISQNPIMNLIMLEYPPYWVHQLLLVASGTKNRLAMLTKNYKLDQDIKKFANEVWNTPSFVDQIEDTL